MLRVAGIIQHLLCKASVTVATSAEFLSPSEHETVAPERSVGVLVVTVEVKGDDDMSLNVYSLLGLYSFGASPRENKILSMSPPVKKLICHISVDSCVTIQVNMASDSEHTSSLRNGMPIIIIRSIILVSLLADILRYCYSRYISTSTYMIQLTGGPQESLV